MKCVTTTEWKKRGLQELTSEKKKKVGGGVYSERPTEKDSESENKEKGKELKEWKKKREENAKGERMK